MSDPLTFPKETYEVRTLTLDNRTITYRAYMGLSYCTHPLDPIQKLNLFVPEAYYHNGTIGNYQADNAPIFLPNTVGGYLPGPADEPGIDTHFKQINSIFRALEHGYVVASGGVRGRGARAIVAQFDATDFDVSFRDIVESSDQGNESRFTRSGRTDDADRLSRMEVKIDIA